MEPQPSQNYHQPVQDYLAFISYRHADNTEEDRQWATWLHQQLEVYDIPADLIGATNLRGELIPERIYPVFRDEISLPADADLSNAVTLALDRSRFLIILCSPRAVQSHYVNQEILHFKQSGKEERIIAAMIFGEPNASIDEAKQDNPEDVRTQECFPEALQYELDSDGALNKHKRTEPIAADFRLPDGSEGATNPNAYKRQLLQDGHSKADAERLAQRYEEQLDNAKLKIIAGILGVRLEQLTQRDRIYQLNKARAAARRFRRIAAAMAGLTLAATLGGGLAYQQWQRTVEERNRAESLLEQVRDNLDFMNFDLRDVMKAYVPTEKRIPLMQRVDEIIESLQETDIKSSEDKRRIAVSLLNKADLILKNRQLDSSMALPLLKKAQSITEQLAGEDPHNNVFQTDLSITYTKLGDIMLHNGEAKAARKYYVSALEIDQSLVATHPEDRKFMYNLSVSYSKIGDAFLHLPGGVNSAWRVYTEALNKAKSLIEWEPTNTSFLHRLWATNIALGDVQLRRIGSKSAQRYYQSSLEIARNALDTEPSNTQLKTSAITSHLRLGNVLVEQRIPEEALIHYQSALKDIESLVKHDPKNTAHLRSLWVAYNKAGETERNLNNLNAALSMHRSALEVANNLVKHNSDNVDYQRNLSVSYSLLGDSYRSLNQATTALEHYQTALAITNKLLENDRDNITLQRDLWVRHYNIAKAYMNTKNHTQAYTSMELAYKQLTWMQDSHVLTLNDQTYLQKTKKEMHRLKSLMKKN